ncbi:hypothetical protein QBC33DRAFT_598619 [Phialemonium atrogriseum]|uniref:Phosphoglycerate mutase n=1 Tax=Phialemonium atrogriseum TaxID=1093897 RepID=A0AAJ0FIK3_9PEZI|nr:uncharacterized protein QBC33DRAFT_598619 [Phialemonium atrogriseum]KAK1763394.1 hypothetical protein QBC33DRAFT_598619 [Phialemonium atrogriseum]
MCRFKFSYVPGYFVDSVEAAKACPSSKLITQPNLGLLRRTYDFEESAPGELPWARFRNHVDALNRNSSPGESYKLLYLVRHGLSVHNIVMAKVGSDSWNNHWSHLEGDGEVTWVDARLTKDGISLAQNVGNLWTTKLVYSPVMTEHERSLQPLVKELLRERLTGHTCDKRSTRLWIAENYPGYVIGEDFEEADPLWMADQFETNDEHVARKQRLLEGIFVNDDSPIVSLTTHSYAISAILEAVEAPHFRVSEGAIVPLFVKATKVEGED